MNIKEFVKKVFVFDDCSGKINDEIWLEDNDVCYPGCSGECEVKCWECEDIIVNSETAGVLNLIHG